MLRLALYAKNSNGDIENNELAVICTYALRLQLKMQKCSWYKQSKKLLNKSFTLSEQDAT